MKIDDLPSIYRTVASLQEPYRLLVIEGDDDFFREDCGERYIDFWKKFFPDGVVKKISVSDLLGHRELLQEGPSLFGGTTLYVVESVSSLKGKKVAELISLLARAHTDLYFLFLDSDPMSKELFSEVEKKGAVFVVQSMKPWDRLPFFINWIGAFVKKRGKTIDKEAASLLAQGYPSDRGGLVQELEKLCMYRFDEPSISMRDVEEIGIVDIQPTMWQLLDALIAGDAKAVASCLVQSSDMHDIAVLRFMKNQLERLLVASESATPPKSKSQERQISALRKRGKARIVTWINRIKMQEVAIRSGLREGEEDALLPFFLSF